MYGISPKFVRTWAALHRALSSGLILGVLAGANANANMGFGGDVRELLDRLLVALGNINTIEGDVGAIGSANGGGGVSEGTEEGPLDKGIIALRMIRFTIGNTMVSPALG